MNRKLIELYFEVQKELDISSEEEGKQIEAFGARLIEENEKKIPPNLLRNSILAKFQNEKIIPLLQNSHAEKGKKLEPEQECLQLILKILEEILGDDLVQAKKMVKEKQLEMIIEQYVK